MWPTNPPPHLPTPHSHPLLERSHTYIHVGHTHIDILKIDLEGWEFDALSAFLTAFPTLPIGQLQIELHIWNRGFEELLKVFEALEGAGLRAFMSEVGFCAPFHLLPWHSLVLCSRLWSRGLVAFFFGADAPSPFHGVIVCGSDAYADGIWIRLAKPDLPEL